MPLPTEPQKITIKEYMSAMDSLEARKSDIKSDIDELKQQNPCDLRVENEDCVFKFGPRNIEVLHRSNPKILPTFIINYSSAVTLLQMLESWIDYRDSTDYRNANHD